MAILSSRGGGLDGQAKTGVAGLCVKGATPIRTCSTRTAARVHLADWRLAAEGTPLALERTGVSWRPVCPLGAAHVTVLGGHAPHLTAGPGRQTDGRDGAGMGARLRHGLLQGRVRPPRHSRAWRDVTRHRPLVGRDRAAVANRLPPRMAAAHRTRGPVAPHVLGLAGRGRRQALADGAAEAAPRAPLAQGNLRAQTAHLQPSLTGHWPPTPRVLLQAR